MTLAGDCGWGLLRGFGIAFAAVAVAGGVRALISSAPRRTGRVIWALHLVPLLTPVLLAGYAWSRFSLSLIRHPACNQALYCALVWLRLVPVATLALCFAPTPLSPAAMHCHRLAGRGGLRRVLSAVGFWLRGQGRAVAVAFALVFLLAFGEFEMASLLCIRTWTDTLFVAQIGGLSLLASFRLALPAVACQAALLLLVLGVLLSARPPGRIASPRRVRPGRTLSGLVWTYLAVALAAVTLVPTFVVLRGTLEGLALMAQTLTLTWDIVASLAFAAGAAGLGYGCAGWLLRRARRDEGWRRPLVRAFLLCVPGLLGGLLLALVVLAAFQLPALRTLYDTPLPLLLALGLLLFPFALLLRVLFAVSRPAAAVHAASLLEVSSSQQVVRKSRRTLWEMRSRGLFWVAFVLFWWGYFELTAASLLAPSQMTPVLVRLYNMMHYGQTSVLSAMVCVAFAVPFVALLVAVLARRALHWALAR